METEKKTLANIKKDLNFKKNAFTIYTEKYDQSIDNLNIDLYKANDRLTNLKNIASELEKLKNNIKALHLANHKVQQQEKFIQTLMKKNELEKKKLLTLKEIDSELKEIEEYEIEYDFYTRKVAVLESYRKLWEKKKGDLKKLKLNN